MTSRDEIARWILDKTDEDLIILDGLEDAFIGVAERFEPDGHHRTFAVYDQRRMVELLMSDGGTEEEALEYIEFNVIGLYAGETTPAIFYRMEEP